jgi:hypothetical protein
MKQVITLLLATLFTLSAVASVRPIKITANYDSKSIIKNKNILNVHLQEGGNVNIGWAAGVETTTTNYSIQKSINGGAFKTVAILMGESSDSYFFCDSIKDFTGNVRYRVVTVNSDAIVKTLAQTVIVF